MPVTARLSGKFYERFGDEIANELFAFWSATVIPLIGVMLALSGTFRR